MGLSRTNFKNLHLESYYLQGARNMLLRILDDYRLSPKVKLSKDEAVYTKANIELALSSMENTRKYLENCEIRYYDWQKDKKGKLVSAKAMFITDDKDMQEWKRLTAKPKA